MSSGAVAAERSLFCKNQKLLPHFAAATSFSSQPRHEQSIHPSGDTFIIKYLGTFTFLSIIINMLPKLAGGWESRVLNFEVTTYFDVFIAYLAI